MASAYLRIILMGPVTAFLLSNQDQKLTFSFSFFFLSFFFFFCFSSLTADRDRETIEELSAALRDEKARTEQMQLALTNEKRQTEALKHAKERADHLRNVNKGNKTMSCSFALSVPSFNSPLSLGYISFHAGFDILVIHQNNEISTA